MITGEFEPDLEALCSDRPEDGTEIFAPNAWYGAASIIRQYSGWPASRPLPIVLPHGVELSPDFIYDGEVENRLPAIYSFPAYRDEAYRAATTKPVIPGCSPWLYLPRPATEASERRTVLVMPAHSVMRIKAVMDDVQFAEAVSERYPGEDIRCCMFWYDVQLGRHLPYRERGMPVVSAGHTFDPKFFERLASLFSTAKLLVTNDVGSHIFYAASHDVPVTIMSDSSVEWDAPPELLARYYSPGIGRTFADIEPMFREASPDITRQRPAAEMMLGAERRHTRTELRSLLEQWWRTPGFRSRVVPFWRVGRRIAPARSLLRRMLG